MLSFDLFNWSYAFSEYMSYKKLCQTLFIFSLIGSWCKWNEIDLKLKTGPLLKIFLP